MPSCFPVFFNSSKSKSKKRSGTLSNSSNDQVDQLQTNSASTLIFSNDSLSPNGFSNDNVNTINTEKSVGTPNVTTHTSTKEVVHEYAPVKSESQVGLNNDHKSLERLNGELKLSQSELKSTQLKLRISTEKNKKYLREQERLRKELDKKETELENAQKRIDALLKKDKELEDVNRQVKAQLKASNIEPEVEALITGLAYSLKEAYAEIEDYKAKENDLLVMANETGEEIRKLQMKQRDARLIVNECGQELYETKRDLDQAFHYIDELKGQLKNSEQIIVGLVDELKSANADYEDLQKENNDLNTIANETGEEIVHLRSVNKDQYNLINEVGQELCEAKGEIDHLKKENEALGLLVQGLGQECVSTRDRCVHLETTENDLLLLANECGEEIQALHEKVRDQNTLINECGNELVDAKQELAHTKATNQQYCLIIEGLAHLLNENNEKIAKYETETQDLMELANETGEEIVNLRFKINDSNSVINELGNELLDAKEKAAHYQKCANLFIDFIDVLSKEYEAAALDKNYLENERDDLLAMANETGEEIIATRLKLRDDQELIKECTTELIEAKIENEQLKQQLEQVRQFVSSYEVQPIIA